MKIAFDWINSGENKLKRIYFYVSIHSRKSDSYQLTLVKIV